MNNDVSKQWAREVYGLCTRCTPDTHNFFTELLTISSCEEQCLQKQAARDRLKHAVAAVWECCRYGWTQQTFGRVCDPTIASSLIRCRRTRVLIRAAIRAGRDIAVRQSEAS